jgi:hypothetical protein
MALGQELVDIYQQRHIPIHYLLLVGYDQATAYVHDTGQEEVQALPVDALEAAWEVNVPGLGKRNRFVVLEIPEQLAPTDALIQRSIADQCEAMLSPPVSMVGIPAMEKVAVEIAHWPEELGTDAAEACLRQVRAYLNSPPDLEGDHLTAGRDLYVAFLKEAGQMADLDFSHAIERLRGTVAMIPQLAQAIRHGDLAEAGACFDRIAQGEKQAYIKLETLAGASGAAS